MEETLQFNRQTIEEIKSVLRYLAANKEHADWKRLYQLISTVDRTRHMPLSAIVNSVVNHTTHAKQSVVPAVLPSDYCQFPELAAASNANIQVSFSVLRYLSFVHYQGSGAGLKVGTDFKMALNFEITKKSLNCFFTMRWPRKV